MKEKIQELENKIQFQEEFKKEKIKIINSLEKSLGFALPEATNLVQVFNLYKEIEGK